MARMGILMPPILDWHRMGRLKSDLPVSLTAQGQTAAWSLSSWSRYFSGDEVPMDPNDPNGQKMLFDGGCTLVADLRNSQIQYCIRKNTSSDARLLRQQGFAMQLAATSSSYFGTLREGVVEPFAAIHRGM